MILIWFKKRLRLLLALETQIIPGKWWNITRKKEEDNVCRGQGLWSTKLECYSGWRTYP